MNIKGEFYMHDYGHRNVAEPVRKIRRPNTQADLDRIEAARLKRVEKEVRRQRAYDTKGIA